MVWLRRGGLEVKVEGGKEKWESAGRRDEVCTLMMTYSPKSWQVVMSRSSRSSLGGSRGRKSRRPRAQRTEPRDQRAKTKRAKTKRAKGSRQPTELLARNMAMKDKGC